MLDCSTNRNETICYLSGNHQDRSINPSPTINKNNTIGILEESIGDDFYYFWVCQNVQNKITRREESIGEYFQYLPSRKVPKEYNGRPNTLLYEERLYLKKKTKHFTYITFNVCTNVLSLYEKTKT